MQVCMIVVTGAAADFGHLLLHQGDDRVIGKTAALDAVVVNDVA